MSAPATLLKMSQLAAAAGVTVGTIKHYLREGLLGGPDVVKTSRNMAYYPPHYVERVKLIKRLQEERFLPLRLIGQALEQGGVERLERLVELEDRIVESAREADRARRTPRAELLERVPVPPQVLDRLQQLGILTPDRRGYDAEDVRIVEAIARFREGGYEEAIGFTVYDTLRYRDALEPLVREEVGVLLERVSAVSPDRAVEIIASGREPLRQLVGAMHSKLLTQALRGRAR